MSNPTQMRRRVNTTGVRPFDEGCADVDTRPPSSARRYQAPPQTTSAGRSPLSGDVPPRARAASRPAPRTAPVKYDAVEINTQDDPEYRRRPRSRTTDSYDPRLVRQQARSYVEDPEPEEQPQYNRRQRRKLSPGEALLVKVLCALVIAALLLYFLGSIAFSAFTINLSDPAKFGPEHGNVVELIDGSQRYYIQGINDHGQTEIISIPKGHPDQTKIYIGPLGTDHDANVDLQLKDVNHDGHDDIIEHIEPKSFFWLFTPRPSEDFIYLNDGKGQFKLQQPDQQPDQGVNNGK